MKTSLVVFFFFLFFINPLHLFIHPPRSVSHFKYPRHDSAAKENAATHGSLHSSTQRRASVDVLIRVGSACVWIGRRPRQCPHRDKRSLVSVSRSAKKRTSQLNLCFSRTANVWLPFSLSVAFIEQLCLMHTPTQRARNQNTVRFITNYYLWLRDGRGDNVWKESSTEGGDSANRLVTDHDGYSACFDSCFFFFFVSDGQKWNFKYFTCTSKMDRPKQTNRSCTVWRPAYHRSQILLCALRPAINPPCHI